MKNRETFLADFAERYRNAKGRLPLLTLAEFFDGNTEEDSIAPNQWGYDRPTLAEIHARLREVEARPDVAWVRVELHDDTQVEGTDCDIAGNSIALCTTASAEEIERAADTEWLGSDGVIEGWSSSPESLADVPAIPEGHRVVSIVWD